MALAFNLNPYLCSSVALDCEIRGYPAVCEKGTPVGSLEPCRLELRRMKKKDGGDVKRRRGESISPRTVCTEERKYTKK